MSIQKIRKEDIDFSKIYGTKYDADNQQNNLKVNEIYWGDNGDLYFDEDTGMISENGVTLGFTNKDSLKNTETLSNSGYNGSYRDDSDIMKQPTRIEKIDTIDKDKSNHDKVGEKSYMEDSKNSIDEEVAPIDNIEESSENTNDVEKEIKIEEDAPKDSSDSVIEDINEVDIEEIVPEAEESSSTSQGETVEEISTSTSHSGLAQGVDIAIQTAFAEGAYNSEEDARKIADVIINRAVNDGTSVEDVVSAPGQFTAYRNGVNGKGNWGWNNYGSGPTNDSIGTERVKEIFMEELNKASSGQGTTYGYTGFYASGDGRTNVFR